MIRSKGSRLLLGALFFAPLFSIKADSLIIPQIADGGGWKTTFVLTNTSASATTVTLVFHLANSDGSTQIWNLPLQEGSSTQNLALAGGGTLFLHTFGTSSTTSVGWGEVQANSTVQAYAVFGSSNVEATGPGQIGSNRVLVPFDNTPGYTTSLALVNLAQSAQTVAVNIRTTDGTVTNTTLGTVPALGHMAFAIPAQFPATGGLRGLAELSGSSGNLAGVALRFNSAGNFTAAPAYAQAGSTIIGSNGLYPQLSGVTFAASSVAYGGTVQGTVTLNAAAPTGGALVALVSSSTIATVPASVTIPAGATSATFTVTAGAVDNNTSATVTATYGGSSASATLTVTVGTKVSFTELDVASLSFQPTGYSPYTFDFMTVTDATATSLAANLYNSNPAAVFAIWGASSDGGTTFLYTEVTNNLFAKPNTIAVGGVTYTVTSARIAFTLAAATSSTGSLTGTMTVSGKSSAGSTVTLTGPIAGNYTMNF